jgi:D-xylonolactonase
MEPGEISDYIYHLAECPLWNPTENKFYWTDIPEGEISNFNPENSEIALVWKCDMLIGGFAFTSHNDIILATEKGIYKLSRNQSRHELKKIASLPLDPLERCNDVTTDPAGRLLVGTKSKSAGGSKLFIIEKDTGPRILLDNLGLSNGMTFSVDLKYFFHTDSPYFKITRYRYDNETGNIDHPEVFFRGSPEMGFPDGITMDSEDHLWVAFWGASKIRRISPDGIIVQEISFPAIQISSLIFGGTDMNTLLITSACEGYASRTSGTDSKGNFLGGKIYKVTLPFAGRKEWLANF